MELPASCSVAMAYSVPIMEALETCLGVVMIDSAHLVACGENDANFESSLGERAGSGQDPTFGTTGLGI